MKAPGRRILAWALLTLAFLFRLGFGLTSAFWSEDEIQIYLLGLGHHAAMDWPYFGPDIVWTQTQIPGALQALLVGAPMDWLPVPEAPYLLLNVLSFGALCLFAAWVCRRLPELPRWLVWGWTLTAPWALHFSTHIVNPSFVLPASILFFVGALEASPVFRVGLLGVFTSHFFMGFAVLWIAQLHLSWTLLLPFLLLAFALRLREGGKASAGALAATLAGMAVSGSLLLPTLLAFGRDGGGGIEGNLQFHPLGPWRLLTITAQFLSFASFEMSRFLGLSTAQRLGFLSLHPALAPFAALLAVAGIAQVLTLVAVLLFGRSRRPEWPYLRGLVVAAVTLVYASYFFAASDPRAHAFYVLWPAAMIAGFYVWDVCAKARGFRVAAAVLLAAGVVYHAGLAVAMAPVRSLYKNRTVVAAALLSRRPACLGLRRTFARDAPWSKDASGRLGMVWPNRDVRVLRPRWSTTVRRIAVWKMSLRNQGQVAYRELRFLAEYRSASGAIVDKGRGTISVLIQPGETVRVLDLVDRSLDPRATEADLWITGAERVMPLAMTGR